MSEKIIINVALVFYSDNYFEIEKNANVTLFMGHAFVCFQYI